MADELDDVEFLRQFEECELPHSEWTHRAHVRAGFLYVRAHGFEKALPVMRRSVKRYNASQNTPETPTSGYNETTTHAFLHLIAAMMEAYGAMAPTPDSQAFCEAHPQLLSSRLLRLYYSPDRRMLPLAKSEFVEPDLAPLPRIGNSIE